MRMKRTSLVDIVVERIKQYIVENDLKPNSKFLTEKELVEQLQVSRTVVREALISLEVIGILTIKGGGGIFIADPQLHSIHTILKHHYDTYGVKIKELVEIRKVMELGALRLMIENKVAVNIKELHDINELYRQQVIHSKDTKKYDQLFHQSLIKGTNNQTFFVFNEIINEYFDLVKIELIENKDGLLQSYEQHKDMIITIEQGDLHRAQTIMNEHFEPIFTFIHEMEETS